MIRYNKFLNELLQQYEFDKNIKWNNLDKLLFYIDVTRKEFGVSGSDDNPSETSP